MVHAPLVFIAMATLGSVIGHTQVGHARSVLESSNSFNETCQKIAISVSGASEVYYATSNNYTSDISHWASSSTQIAACSFEPGTLEDVGIALQILGETRTPFAVKGGGHATNPRFSSTKGVQIAMSRFNDVVYDSASQTVTIGTGLLWDDVYAILDPQGVNVVGGRVPGVGVAGFTLGGGYSWLTSQYGLTIDTVQALELVMPNGTAVNITETSNPDLFFALKGCQNNFGIVTTITLKTFPQTAVWGGAIYYTADVLGNIAQATANFTANNTDPKAAVITSYNYFSGQSIPIVLVFYDGPTQPAGIFDEFLDIASSTQNVTTRPFFDFFQSLPSNFPTRAVFNTVSLTDHPVSLLELIASEAASWSQKLSSLNVSYLNYDIEPFLHNLFSHNNTPSAYPPDRTRGLFPLNIYFLWDAPSADEAVYDAVRTSAATIRSHAIEVGASYTGAALYPNYAIFDTPLVDLYGANVGRLHEIKRAVDPENVMGLAGGFKL